MKKLFFLLPVFALLVAACSTEFDVAAPWKEIPLAYAIISPKDTAHYIRVEKAFLDPQKSALEIAQIADSLYYPENAITVFLKRVSTGQESQLHRVDGTQEGYPRTGGIFATQPNYLYKIKSSDLGGLQQGEKYQLVVKRADDKPDVTAETLIPRDVIFRAPNPVDLPPKITFSDSKNTLVEWAGDGNTQIFNIVFTVRYWEEDGSGTIVGRDTLTWSAAKNIKRGTATLTTPNGVYYIARANVAGESFFRFLSENIDTSSIRSRYFNGMDITITGGGKELEEYFVAIAANSGITDAEVLANYTNLSEGYGIFTARNALTLKNILILPSTVDSMRVSPLTNRLNFQK